MCQWVCISVRIILLILTFLSVYPHSTGLGTTLKNKEMSSAAVFAWACNSYVENSSHCTFSFVPIWRSKVNWARNRPLLRSMRRPYFGPCGIPCGTTRKWCSFLTMSEFTFLHCCLITKVDSINAEGVLKSLNCNIPIFKCYINWWLHYQR